MATTALNDSVHALREYAADAAGYARHLEHDVRMLKMRATDAIDEARHTAARAVTRGLHELEDLRDATETRIRKAPFRAVGVTFAAGLALGAMTAWLGGRAVRR
jgi:ElaB/YqjD/DUF883 family membrane-anchored ribosome-binding protein